MTRYTLSSVTKQTSGLSGPSTFFRCSLHSFVIDWSIDAASCDDSELRVRDWSMLEIVKRFCCDTWILNINISSSGKKLLKMWVGNVSMALLHFLFSVNNTLSLCQRVQIYLGPTFVGRPNEIFKTKLCLIRMYSVHQTVLNAKKTNIRGVE